MDEPKDKKYLVTWTCQEVVHHEEFVLAENMNKAARKIENDEAKTTKREIIILDVVEVKNEY